MNSTAFFQKLFDEHELPHKNLHIVTTIQREEELNDVVNTIFDVLVRRGEILASSDFVYKCKISTDQIMILWLSVSLDRIFCATFDNLADADIAFNQIQLQNIIKIKEKMKSDET